MRMVLFSSFPAGCVRTRQGIFFHVSGRCPPSLNQRHPAHPVNSSFGLSIGHPSSSSHAGLEPYPLFICSHIGADIPKAARASTKLSDMDAKSSPDAAARFIIPSMPSNISLVCHSVMAIVFFFMIELSFHRRRLFYALSRSAGTGGARPNSSSMVRKIPPGY